MDLLESPLNLAHQQSRKADRYLKSSRFDDAIECHRKAADYLTKAMAGTTIQQALESLSLQREHHVRQQAIVREKQQRALLSERSTPDRSGTQSATRPAVTAQCTADRGSCSSDAGSEGPDDVQVHRTMEECDSLLQFLNNRGMTTERYNPPISLGTKPEGNKSSKSDKVVIEELRLHNDALRSHIVQFLKDSEEQQRQIAYFERELEYTRKENRDLKDRLTKVEPSHLSGSPKSDQLQSDTFYSIPMALNLDKLPALELPPLEMPKFDFDSLKSNNEDETTTVGQQ